MFTPNAYPLAASRGTAECLDLLTDVSTPRIGAQGSFTHGFQHTPEKSKKDFQDSIRLFLDDCRPAMKTLVSKAGHIPSFMASWTPGASIDPRLSDHILRLNIPQDKGGLPSLLLHDLGEEKSDLDKLRASRIPGIFSNKNTCVVHFVMVHFTYRAFLGYSLIHLDQGSLEFSSKAYVGIGGSTL